MPPLPFLNKIRIIPAYAGPTLMRFMAEEGFKDHPRIRGAYVLPIHTLHRLKGSSPHTRGLPSALKILRAIYRIIPAYAGPTFLIASLLLSTEDHPRIRGAY